MKKHRQYRSNQGRSPRKEEQIMNVLRVAFPWIRNNNINLYNT